MTPNSGSISFPDLAFSWALVMSSPLWFSLLQGVIGVSSKSSYGQFVLKAPWQAPFNTTVIHCVLEGRLARHPEGKIRFTPAKQKPKPATIVQGALQ